MTTAYQSDAYQNNAYQIDSEAAVEGFAFQQCAFQDDAFQVDTCGTGERTNRGGGWDNYVAPLTRKTLKQYKQEYLDLSYFEIEEIKAESKSEIKLAQNDIRFGEDLGETSLIARLKLVIEIQKIKLQALAWVEQERANKAKIVAKLQKDKNIDADLVFIAAYLMDENDDG